MSVSMKNRLGWVVGPLFLLGCGQSDVIGQRARAANEALTAIQSGFQDASRERRLARAQYVARVIANRQQFSFGSAPDFEVTTRSFRPNSRPDIDRAFVSYVCAGERQFLAQRRALSMLQRNLSAVAALTADPAGDFWGALRSLEAPPSRWLPQTGETDQLDPETLARRAWAGCVESVTSFLALLDDQNRASPRSLATGLAAITAGAQFADSVASLLRTLMQEADRARRAAILLAYIRGERISEQQPENVFLTTMRAALGTCIDLPTSSSETEVQRCAEEGRQQGQDSLPPLHPRNVRDVRSERLASALALPRARFRAAMSQLQANNTDLVQQLTQIVHGDLGDFDEIYYVSGDISPDPYRKLVVEIWRMRRIADGYESLSVLQASFERLVAATTAVQKSWGDVETRFRALETAIVQIR